MKKHATPPSKHECPCGGSRTYAVWQKGPLAALSISFSLRAIEALSVSFDGEQVTFVGAKGRRGRKSETPGTWASAWGEFLRSIRTPPGRVAWYTLRAALHKGLGELVGRPGLSSRPPRWQSWRQFGAA